MRTRSHVEQFVFALTEPDALSKKIENLLSHHNAILRGLGAAEIDASITLEKLMRIAPKLLKYAPVWRLLDTAYRGGQRILFEGAQGFMLDVDHGTYPFVTSSNTLAGQAAAGSGVAVAGVGYVLGITKAYTTGLDPDLFRRNRITRFGMQLGERGHEFGTVTGRQRRCGWFDAVLVRQSATMGGIRWIALTKLDVLDGIQELKVCVGYEFDGETFDYFRLLGKYNPASSQYSKRCRVGGYHTRLPAAGFWCQLRR